MLNETFSVIFIHRARVKYYTLKFQIGLKINIVITIVTRTSQIEIQLKKFEKKIFPHVKFNSFFMIFARMFKSLFGER